jgi:hypothetical protein
VGEKMEPMLLFEDSFNTFTNGLNKKEYESLNEENIKITFIEAISKPRSLWFIKLEANGSTYYLWVGKKHFERFRKLLKNDKTGKSMFFQELRRTIFYPWLQ